jgi:hypothetical protein
LSAPASVTSEGGAALTALKYADVLIVIASTPFVLVFGAPALGFAVGAGAWIAQRAVGELLTRRASSNARRAMMTSLVFSLGRVWVLALIILAVGKAVSREDGLTCALVVLAAFTVYFAMNLILHSSFGRAQTS